MTSYLAGVPDFRFEIADWAERGGTVFVEAHNSAGGPTATGFRCSPA